MKLFHETKIDFYSERELKICVVSDIHFSYQVKDNKLDALIKKLRERNPDYIFLPGDLVDSNDMIFDPAEEKRLLNFLENLGKIGKLIISQGNHDVYKKASKAYRKKTGDTWELFENTAFTNKLRKLKNVVYLDNEKYEDKNIFVLGLTQSPNYYNFFNQKRKVTIFNPVNENVEIFLKELDALDKKLLTNLPKNKLKFALIHSPVALNDLRAKAKLKEFNYFISGHMHNGIIPPILDELSRTTRGIVSPTRNLFPSNIRNTIKTPEDKNIVAGAITTWHECTGPAHHLNALYPSYFMTLTFNPKNQKKPITKKKYLKF